MAVLVDSGFRRGTDIIKALAMGAQAVCIGRPYLWGLGASVSRVSSASWRSCVGKRVPPCRRSERINQAPNLGSGAAGLSLSRHGTKDLAAGHARDAVRNLVQMFAFHPFEPIPAGDRERQVWVVFETFPWLAARSPTDGLAQVPSTDLHVPILGQQAPSQFPLGDAFEPGPLETISLAAALGGGYSLASAPQPRIMHRVRAFLAAPA